MQLKHKYLLTGTELCAAEINDLIQSALALKQDRLKHSTVFAGKHLGLIFDKPSLRTRFSFTVAMRELGGDIVESVSASRKAEDPEDQMRVLQGYCHAVMVRTHEDSILTRMQTVASIPIINGLSDLYHPCQILADLMTLKEKFGRLDQLSLCYIGDGNNVLHSLLLMAPLVGVNIHYCCPPDCGPNALVLQQAQGHSDKIKGFTQPSEAVKGCHAVYTDVWTSMGAEVRDENIFAGMQVNAELMSLAQADAVFMHCMPMNRGQEVSRSLPDQTFSVVFQQSENRLHVQKALLFALL